MDTKMDTITSLRIWHPGSSKLVSSLVSTFHLNRLTHTIPQGEFKQFGIADCYSREHS